MGQVLTKTKVLILIISLVLSCKKDDGPEVILEESPTITSFQPTSGTVGTMVTINGIHFASSTNENSVKFGEHVATVESASASKIIAYVPQDASTGKISVTVNGTTATSAIDFVALPPVSLELDKKALELFTLDMVTLIATSSDGNHNTFDWSSDNEKVAIVDKNGTVTAVGAGMATITASLNGAEANCMVKVNPNVYVVGREKNENDVSVAILWENGIAQQLLNGDSDSYALSVHGNEEDIYVVGYMKNEQNISVGMLWKNGEVQQISDGTIDTYPRAVFVVDEDVYIAGYVRNSNNIMAAVLWKNGEPQEFSDGTVDTFLRSVYVSGDDIYVSGHINTMDFINIPVLWINGVPEHLSNGTLNAYAASVFVK